MKNRMTQVVLSLGMLFLFAGSAAAQAEKWVNDPPHSGAYFQIGHNFVNTLRGSFHKMNVVVMYDAKDVTKTTIDATIDATSIDTDFEARDKDLRSANYFDVEKYPTLSFKSKKVQVGVAGKLKLTGDLTIHGVTKEVTFDVDGPTQIWTDTRNNRNNPHLGAEATTKINRKDFGITMNPLVGDDVFITMSMDLVKPAPAPARGAGSN